MSSEVFARRIHVVSGLLLLGTFLAGAVSGFGAAFAVRRPDPSWFHGDHPPLPRQFEDLGLSAIQQRQAQAIFERFRPELDAVLRESYPRVRAVNERIEAELRAILTPEQVRRLDALKARRPGLPGGPGFPGGPEMGPPPAPPG
jgi:hypothetical protein